MDRKRVALLNLFFAVGLLAISGLFAASSGVHADLADDLVSFETNASLGTGFSYQGELSGDRGPIHDVCDLQFSLWDAASNGNQLGNTQTETGINIVNGAFSAILNGAGEFGGSAFIGEARWLAISVRCPTSSGGYTSLSPRQALPSVPFALYAKSVGTHNHFDAFWAGSADRGLQVINSTGHGIVGVTNATSGFQYGVEGISDSPEGNGVHGLATATSGGAFGVLGESRSPTGTGVLGEVDSPTGYSAGVRGTSESTQGTGVSGVARAASGNTAGVRGRSESPTGIGVEGVANATSGVNYGIYGWTQSPAGFAGYFDGNVSIDGTLTKSAGSFRIDHPLDPELDFVQDRHVGNRISME